MSSKVNQATMETVQESMGEAYESLQALKKLVSSYAKNSDILKSLNDVLQSLRVEIKTTNEIYKDDEKNIKSLLSHVYDITNEQKHISMQIPLIIKQVDQNETIQVMRSFDEKASEYQENLKTIILKMNDVFDVNFAKWNNSTSHLEYSNYVHEIKKIHEDIISSFKKLDLSELNDSFYSSFESFNKDVKGIISLQNNKLETVVSDSLNLKNQVSDGFQNIHKKCNESLEFFNTINLKESLDRTQQLLNVVNEKTSLSINKIEESMGALKSKFDVKFIDLERKFESLEKAVVTIEKVQSDSLSKINDLLNAMEENQKIIIEQTKKKGWFS